MTSNNNSILKPSEALLQEAAQKACQTLIQDRNALSVLVRRPILDEKCPETSDVDLLAVWEKPEECPERLLVQMGDKRIFVDVLWIPAASMLDSDQAASFKILPHLLLESDTLYVQSEAARCLMENVKLLAYKETVWQKRLGNQISFGDAAFEEAKKNADFPPAALFFLQTAHSYYIMALADCLKYSTMSLLTKPASKLKQIDADFGWNLHEPFTANLCLDVNPLLPLLALRRIFDGVTARCSGRQLRGVCMRTRSHYIYTLSPLELEYREQVAKALFARGDFENANFYTRFWAYSLSRCPVVLDDASNGRKPSFYVPIRSLKDAVVATCPEILDDLQTVLGSSADGEQTKASIEGTAAFRQQVLDQIQAKGLSIRKIKEGAAFSGKIE